MKMPWHLLRWSWYCLILLGPLPAGAAEQLSRQVADMNQVSAADFKTGSARVEQFPDGQAAWRFDEPFGFRLDLKPQGVESRDFDLIKLKVKADRGAFMRVAVENHPREGDISYWYVLDGMRGAFDWKTIWVDLDRPEEIKSGDDHRSPWREGIAADQKDLRGVRIEGTVNDLKSQAQGSQRRVWLGGVRFVKEAVHIDWDQTKAPYAWGAGEDLVFTYPLTLTNKLERPVTAKINFEPVEVKDARAEVDTASVPLEPGETQTIAASIILPAAKAAQHDPLYCERFLVTAAAEGIDDSTVTLLRSSDPIHLTVTVPLDEKQLTLPLFPRPSELPASVLKFDEKMARQHAAHDPQPLIDKALKHGLYQYSSDKDEHRVGQYRQTLISAAYLYDMTGDERHLQTARELLLALPKVWKRWYDDYKRERVRIISSGIVARWKDRSHYTLGMGWLVLGTQRSPYYYGTSGNGRGGSMGALAYAFDIIAPQLSEQERQQIIDGFFLPAGIQARNHYIGDGNQQMTADLTAMYAGLVARNWPLVSFGYSSEHGLENVLEWSFDDDGVQLRKNYQTYTMRPILWATELLYGAGFDVYERYEDRLVQIVNADTEAKNQGGPFQDHEFWEFIKEQRLP